MDHDRHHGEAEAAAGQALLLLAALAVPLGTHCWRALLPLLVWHWGTTLDLNAWLVALFAILPLLLGPAAFWLAGRMPPGIGLWLAGGGLVLWRLALQAAPAATTKAWAAMLGAACFVWLLLLLAGGLRRPGAAGWPALALGLVAGLGLDTALRGLAGTLELVWIAGPWPYLPLLAFGAIMAWALRSVARAGGLTEPRPEGAPGGPGLALVGFGLLLFLHWQLFQNQGWLAQLAGWPPAAALGWITLGNVLALLAAARTVGAAPGSLRRRWAVLAGTALLLGTVLAARPGWAAPLGFLLALPASGAVLALLGGGRYRAGRAPLALWLGLILGIALLFLYYYSLIEPLLPFARSLLAPLAALGAAAGALAAAREPRPAGSAHQPAAYRPALALALLLLLAPALLALRGQEASPQPPPAGFPVHVMTYNIRAAYGLDGLQDVEAVARVVESSGAEVVGLQELSRGWFANGSSDLLALLARRLAMPYTAMGPAMDPVAGNTILSRYPILDSGHGLLPLAGALVPRGVVWAQLDLGGGQTLLVVNTHLDADEATIRQAQLPALLAQWPAGSRTVLLGDMNAEPGSGEIALIAAAGYLDAGPTAAGALTTHRDHAQRIDWIFHSPDLLARDAAIIPSRASDHLPVAATIERRP
jgi:endonuclease/exonuclease/phosphatase family metal-dependent hydrolase